MYGYKIEDPITIPEKGQDKQPKLRNMIFIFSGLYDMNRNHKVNIARKSKIS